MLLHCCLKIGCSLCWNLMTRKSKKLLSRKFFQSCVSNQPRRDWRRSLKMKLPSGHNWLAFLKVASVNLFLQKTSLTRSCKMLFWMTSSLIYQIYLHTLRVLKGLLSWHLKLLSVYGLESRHRHIHVIAISCQIRPSFASKGSYSEHNNDFGI